MRKRRMVKRKAIRKKPVIRRNVKKQAAGSKPFSAGYAKKGGQGLLYSLIITGSPYGTSSAARDTIQTLDFSDKDIDVPPVDRAVLEELAAQMAPIMDQYALEIVAGLRANDPTYELFDAPETGQTISKYAKSVNNATASVMELPLIPHDKAAAIHPSIVDFDQQVLKFRKGLMKYLSSRIFDEMGTQKKKGAASKTQFSALKSAVFGGEKKSSVKVPGFGASTKKTVKKTVSKPAPKATPKPAPKPTAKKQEVVATIDEKAIEDLRLDVGGMRYQLDAFVETFTQLEERVAKLSPQKLNNPRKVSIGGSYRFFPHPYTPSLATTRAAGSKRRKNPRGVSAKLPVKGFTRTPRRTAEGLYPSASYARQDKFPIGDAYHARLALVYVLSPSNARARKSVIKAVAKNYPKYAWAQWWADQRKGKAGVKSWTYYLKS